MFGYEISAGRFVAVCTALHERGFAPADVRPSDYPCLLQGFHYTFD